MKPEKIRKLRVTAHQLARMATDLRSSSGLVSNGRERPQLQRDTLPADEIRQWRYENCTEAHLTEDECIDYRMRKLPKPDMRRAEQHLELCEECAEQIERLEAFSYLGLDPDVLRRLEVRVRSWTLRIEPGQRPFDPIKAAIIQALRSIAPLAGAYGAPDEEETLSIDFPVTLDGQIIDALSGQIQRKGREYYARIRITDLEQGALGDRKVVLILASASDGQPLLQRTVDVGVAVLLGMDLALAEHSYMVAWLLPESESAD